MTKQEAIDELESLLEHCQSMKEHKHHEPWESDVQALSLAISALEGNPGKWMKIPHGYMCDNCGTRSLLPTPFCSFCGASMEEFAHD